MESIDVVLTELAEGEGEGGTRTWDRGKAKCFITVADVDGVMKELCTQMGDSSGCYSVKLVDGFENWSGNQSTVYVFEDFSAIIQFLLGSQSKEYISRNLNVNTLNVYVAEGPINRRHHITHWLLRCKDAEIEFGIQCHVRTG